MTDNTVDELLKIKNALTASAAANAANAITVAIYEAGEAAYKASTSAAVMDVITEDQDALAESYRDGIIKEAIGRVIIDRNVVGLAVNAAHAAFNFASAADEINENNDD